MNIRQILLATIILLAGSTGLNSQNYNFLEYGVESGLCDNFIYNIIQDDKGYLWIGTGQGICRYDGIEFESDFPGDSLPNVPVKESFIDSRGNLWFGFDNGLVAFFSGGSFKRIDPGKELQGTINGIEEDDDGNIYVATQNKGILKISTDLQVTQLIKGLEGQLISSMAMSPEGIFLIGTFEGLSVYSYSTGNNSLELVQTFEELEYVNVQSIRPKDDGSAFYICTEGEGLYYLTKQGESNNFELTKTGEDFNLVYTDVLDVHKDGLQNLWISAGGEGIYRLNFSKDEDRYISISLFSESNGLISSYIKDIFEDSEGNFWLGSFGSGLSALKDMAFSFYRFPEEKFNNNILSLVQVGNEYWLGTENGIIVTDLSNKEPEFLGPGRGLPADQVTSLYYDPDGVVWAGTSRSGIYRFSRGSKYATRFFISQNSLENSINRITKSGNELWAATNGGILKFNTRSGRQELLTMSNGLPHNKIRDIFIDSENNAWVATRSNGIYNRTQKENLPIDAQAELEFISITEDHTGTLWGVTYGDGVFGFHRDSLIYFSTLDGLHSNYCYSIAEDENGNIWIGNRSGLSRINKQRTNINSYSIEQGISSDCNFNAVIENNLHELIFGTSNGLITYNPAVDKPDSIPPKLNLISLKISDEEYDFSEPIDLPYGRYKVHFEWIGINLKNPEAVTYRYQLEGYDDDWSDPTSQTSEDYPRLEDGNYVFRVIACDENGICTEEPIGLRISINIPIWKAWWFILSMILLVVLTVYVIIKVRERKQRQLQEYLQRSLDERTKEVREQAAEIENKNRDITDSINYAQRIQASILPPISKLQNTFSGSFVYYQPRDIVSGDFYWYDIVEKDKFLIVCADSTGHGVPGAFMSMIGTTLIKDICSRPKVDSPAKMLATLDLEIQEALNQNIEAERSNDGMDIIVAEINLITYKLKISSAMRPSILYIDGEQVYVKGSRNSVGGRFDEDSENKVFEEEEFQLSKGDLLYMFSDGYPDQFGGPLGKKFKMVRLKNLLRDIHDKSMEEQYHYVKSNFMLWRKTWNRWMMCFLWE